MQKNNLNDLKTDIFLLRHLKINLMQDIKCHWLLKACSATHTVHPPADAFLQEGAA